MKKFVALVLVLICVLGLVACDKQEANEVANPTFTDITVSTEPRNTEESLATTEETVSIKLDKPLDALSFSLTDGIVLRKDSDTQEAFVKNDIAVGGVFLLNCDETLFEDIRSNDEALEQTVLSAFSDLGFPEWETHVFRGSHFGIRKYEMSDGQSEYIAHLVRGYSTCYVFWFDCSQISEDEEISIMNTIASEDISAHLNVVK